MNTEKTRKSIERRDALKVLAATGVGLTTATLLPGKWDKPAMQTGVLPVHAQSSVCNAEIEFAAEGPCQSFPGLACGDFDYVGQWSYTPVYLTPSRVSALICDVEVPSDIVAGPPGTLYVLINQADLECIGSRRITVTFAGGCVGVWEVNPNVVTKPGSLFR